MRSNLWLGRDHLLCVESEGFHESYRRFYFRDIQAVTLRRTRRAFAIGLISGIPTVFLVVAAIAVTDPIGRWFLAGLATVCAIPFVVSLISGPTCTCELRTAVQTENVPSLGRVRRARRVLDRIRPLIAEAQGQLTPEEVSARFHERVAAPGSEPPVTPSTGNGIT